MLYTQPMNRSSFLSSATALAALPVLPTAVGAAGATRIAGVAIPNSSLASEALALSKASLNQPIFNHCLRTYVFAELIAREKGWDHDTEAVFIASILHDVGLSPQHMSDRERFEVDGANVARGLLERHAVSTTRAELVWDAITLHDNSGLARWKAHEVALVNAGVNADFGGSQDILKREDIHAVLQAAPRAGFIDAFLPAVAAVVQHKPFATGNSFVTDVGNRMVPGFHLDNFCDAVRDDPFKGY
jgi:hypothetical protein